MNFFKTVEGLLYPHHCAGCGIMLLQVEELCQNCWEKIELLPDSLCSICSYPLITPSAECGNCSGRKLHFIAAVSAFHHQGLVQQLIARCKYGGDQSLKSVMGKLIAVALKEERLY